MTSRRVLRKSALAFALVAFPALGACGGGTSTTPAASKPAPTSASLAAGDQRFPDVVDVKVRGQGPTYSFEVTMTSPYDTPERYADGWRVKGPDGTVYGVNTLDHDHAGEQPFTRVQSGVTVPAGVEEVVVEGRDRANGFGGTTRTVRLS